MHGRLKQHKTRNAAICNGIAPAAMPELTRFCWLSVEFYLYPTVGTVLIHSAKPELTE